MHLENPYKAFEEADIAELLKYKEGQYFDVKRKQEGKDIAKHLVGFANANPSGGLLLIGVSDTNRDIVGLKKLLGEDYRRKIYDFQEYVAYVKLQIKFIKVKTVDGLEDEVALIYVPHPERIASTSKNEVYMRRGDKSIPLTTDDLIELRQTKQIDQPFELSPSMELKFEDLEQAVLRDYIYQVTGQSIDDVDLERQLVNQHLAVQNKGKIHLTKAGLLLLGKDPTVEVPGAYVRVLKYEGREVSTGRGQNLVQDQEFRGPIPLSQ